MLTSEPFSARSDAFARAHATELVISDFAAAEFASSIARRVRVGQTPRHEGQLILLAFDRWMLTSASIVEVASIDIALASTFLRRLDLTLRTPDAIHIALAQRLGATLATFDQHMAASARTLGVAVTEP